jgi:N6-L-threonylcarbamoyladenine synthase/protein kinase Bud32
MDSKIKEIAKGAEAKIYSTTIFNKEVIIKKRTNKKYRNKTLDKKIIKTRNKQESILIKKARECGVNTPYIYYVGKNKIIEDKLVNTNKHKDYLDLIGKEIAKLHNNNIIHGDLNLINIVTNNKKVYFIDFGLGYISKKIEDKASDLLVFKKTLKSSHITESYWKDIKNNYLLNTNNKNIIEKIQEIEKRGRYL